MYSLYRNPDQDDRTYDCLLTSMAAVQAEGVHASFLFVGDLNGHHQEWLGSTMTNSHGVAPFDFAIVSGCCDQLVVGPTHARGGILDLLMTDVPDLIRVAVVAPIGNSYHSSLSAVISTASAVPPAGFVLAVLEYCSAVHDRLPIHTLNYRTAYSVVPAF